LLEASDFCGKASLIGSSTTPKIKCSDSGSRKT
jgi:hypothetical protein